MFYCTSSNPIDMTRERISNISTIDLHLKSSEVKTFLRIPNKIKLSFWRYQNKPGTRGEKLQTGYKSIMRTDECVSE